MSTRKITAGVIAAALALIVPPVTAAPKPAAKNTHIAGQIFIVTKGQEAIKLALVEVVAVPEKGMIEYINARAAAANTVRREVAPTAVELKQQMNEAFAELRPSLAKAAEMRSEIVRLTERCHLEVPAISVRCRAETEHKRAVADMFEKSLEPQNAKRRDLEAAFSEIKKRYESVALPEVFFSDLIRRTAPFTASSKTDADGKFNLFVPASGRVALVAKANRHAAGTLEEYRWLVWVPVKKGIPKIDVMLANDNLLETACPDCVNYTGLIEEHALE